MFDVDIASKLLLKILNCDNATAINRGSKLT